MTYYYYVLFIKELQTCEYIIQIIHSETVVVKCESCLCLFYSNQQRSFGTYSLVT